jgi:hypothetical protein
MTLRTAWAAITSRPTIAMLGALAGVLLTLQLADRSTSSPVPYVAGSSSRVLEAPKVVEQLPVELAKPKKGTREKLAAEYRAPELLEQSSTATQFDGSMPTTGRDRSLADTWREEVLDEIRVGPFREGEATAVLATIDRATGDVTHRVVTRPPPAIAFGLRRFEGTVDIGKVADEDRSDLILVRLHWRPLRIRERLGGGLAAGWIRIGGVDTTYAAASASIR